MKSSPYWTLCCALSCASTPELLSTEPPKQSGKDNSALSQQGEEGFEQRQRDCWDVPNAEACYEVGMSYEQGLRGERDPKKAREYYGKACELERNPEHCDAAKRVK